MTSPDDPSDPTDPDGLDDRDSSSGGLSDWTEALRDMAPYQHLGWSLAATAAVPPLLGFTVDWWLDTLPWGLLTGGGIALAAVVVQLKRLQKEFGS